MTLLRRFHLNVGQNLFRVGVAEQGTGCPGVLQASQRPLDAFLCDLIPVFLLQHGDWAGFSKVLSNP